MDREGERRDKGVANPHTFDTQVYMYIHVPVCTCVYLPPRSVHTSMGKTAK